MIRHHDCACATPVVHSAAAHATTNTHFHQNVCFSDKKEEEEEEEEEEAADMGGLFGGEEAAAGDY